MIDKQKMRETLDALELCTIRTPEICSVKCPYRNERDETYSGFCEHVLKLDVLSLLRECNKIKEQPQWIPIEDAKKPDYYEPVWVAYRLSDSNVKTRLVIYRGFGKSPWITLANNVFYGNVIAWMRLENPEPPKKGCETK